MNRNIFIDLSRYPYNPNKYPRENQHTVFFCYLLNSENELLHYILSSLMKRKSKIIKYLNPNDYDRINPFVTEYLSSLPVRPDMKIKDKNNKKITIYIENKIDSSQGKYPDDDYNQNTQLKRYLKLAKLCPTDEKWVIYISKNDEYLDKNIQNDSYFAGQYTWHEISDIIETYINGHNLEKNNLIYQFLDYMEANNLKSTKGYEKDYALIWDEYNKFKNITKEYLDDIAKYFKNKKYIINATNYDWYVKRTIFKIDWNDNKKYDGFWINIGFELNHLENNPSEIFISVIAELGIRKKFYDFVNYKKGEELQNRSVELKKIKFDTDSDSNPVFYQKYKPLSDINKFYNLSKDKQIKVLIKWISDSVDQIENSNLLSLLKRQYISYRKNNSSVN